MEEYRRHDSGDSGAQQQRGDEAGEDVPPTQPLLQIGECGQNRGADGDLRKRKKTLPNHRAERIVVEILAHADAELDAEQHSRPGRPRPPDQQRDGHAIQGPENRPPIAEGEAVQRRVGK
jgi:hypothetical protein